MRQAKMAGQEKKVSDTSFSIFCRDSRICRLARPQLAGRH